MKAEDTFSTKGKNHQLTTTKERQIDFMIHLYREKYTDQEIAHLYGIPVSAVQRAINYGLKGKLLRQRNRANV